MKTKQLFLFMAMIVFAIGSVSAQEQSAVKKFNDDGTVNEAVLTQEELRFVKLNAIPSEKLTARDKVDILKMKLLWGDNFLNDDKGMAYTTLTREDVVKQGFPSFVFDMLQTNIKVMNKWMQENIDKYGSDVMVPKFVEANKESLEAYKKERPKLVTEMNAALKQAEAEEAAAK